MGARCRTAKFGAVFTFFKTLTSVNRHCRHIAIASQTKPITGKSWCDACDMCTILDGLTDITGNSVPTDDASAVCICLT